jgi:hypothetical protein
MPIGAEPGLQPVTLHHRRSVAPLRLPGAVDGGELMPKAKGKIPRIKMLAVQPIELNDAQWKSIELAYGRSITPEVREQIVLATNRFIQLEKAEEGVETMSDAIKRIDALHKCAKALIAAIDKRPIGDTTREYVDDGIALEYSSLETGDFGKRFSTRNYVSCLCLELSRFVAACEKTSGQFTDASQNTYWPDGAAREIWIRDLTRLLEAHGLPTGVRKDIERRESLPDDASPFLKFIRALQDCLPNRYQRTSARGALSEAITKARRRRSRS